MAQAPIKTTKAAQADAPEAAKSEAAEAAAPEADRELTPAERIEAEMETRKKVRVAKSVKPTDELEYTVSRAGRIDGAWRAKGDKVTLTASRGEPLRRAGLLVRDVKVARTGLDASQKAEG